MRRTSSEATLLSSAHDSDDSDDSGDTRRRLEAYATQVRREPSVMIAWEGFEMAAGELGEPDGVHELYRAVLGQDLQGDLRETLARRAVEFCEQWLGDDPEYMHSLLLGIVTKEPVPQWAFERLAMALTVEESWERLLGAYDSVLGHDIPAPWRRKLLKDAAQVAKDFADDAARGIGFSMQLLRLTPADEKLAHTLERWAERRERWQDLVDTWRLRLAVVDRDRRRELWGRVVSCLLDRLDAPQQAFDELKTWLTAVPGELEACEALERIVLHPDLVAPIRHDAISLLRSNLEQAGETRRLVRTLERALSLVGAEQMLILRGEVANRLGASGDEEGALGHYAAILLEEAGDLPVRKEIARLAQRAGLFEQQVEALVGAGERCGGTLGVELLVEGAKISIDVLQDPAQAEDLYRRALATGAGTVEQQRELYRELARLLTAEDQRADLLDVLVALAPLAADEVSRRGIRREMAVLAAALGHLPRSIEIWQQCLDEDSGDVEALNELIELSERESDWSKLVVALGLRAEAQLSGAGRRGDLVKAAGIYESQLSDPQRAATIWGGIQQENDGDTESLQALDRLLGTLGRWRELAEVLRRRDPRNHERVLGRLQRTGEILRLHLGEDEEALGLYGEVLELEPEHEDARGAVRELMERPACAAAAVDLLAAAYRRTGHWMGTIELLEPRLEAVVGRSDRQAVILREAAGLLEANGGDDVGAFRMQCRALIVDPLDAATQDAVRRLAELTGEWRCAAEAMSVAAASLSGANLQRRQQLRLASACLYQEQLSNHEAACALYVLEAANDPRCQPVLDAWLDAAVASRDWQGAAEAAWSLTEATDRVPDRLERRLAPDDDDADAWHRLLSCLGQHFGGSEAMSPRLRANWCAQLSNWHEQKLGDADAAMRWAGEACAHVPGDRGALERLVRLRRAHSDVDLVDALERLDQQSPDDVAYLREAATVAFELGSERAAPLLERLFRKSAVGESAAVQADASRVDVRQWALARLVELAERSDDRERAIGWLLEAARLGADSQTRAQYLRRAGETLLAVGRDEHAADILEALSAAAPQDVILTRTLIGLYEKLGRDQDLIRVYRRLAAAGDDAAELVQARLRAVELSLGSVREHDLVDLLRENLDARPGHSESIDAIKVLLSAQGDHGPLASVLEDQAEQVAAAGDRLGAAALWKEAGEIHQYRISDRSAAARAFAAATELVPEEGMICRLIELYESVGDPAAAAYWLACRLEACVAADKVPLLLQLAKLQSSAGLNIKAMASLSAAYDLAPRNLEVRRLFLGRLRDQASWEDLVVALGRATEVVGDAAQVRDYAQEASEIALKHLQRPQAALPSLRRAVELCPEDERLAKDLGGCLVASGELDEARDVFEAVIAAFGRRRCIERACVHVSLSTVLQRLGQVEAAIAELESATKMDPSSRSTLARLGRLAAEAGRWETAERSYRMLLLALGREVDAEASEAMPISRCEVLYELSVIAAARDNTDQSEELVESALDAAIEDAGGSTRLRATLWSRGDTRPLERLLEAEASAARGSFERARLWAELARLRQSRGDAPPDAVFRAWLRVIADQPASPEYHRATYEAATRCEKLELYVKKLEVLCSDTAVSSDPYARCEVLLCWGEVLERDLGDPQRALQLYAEAEQTCVRTIDVWRYQARLAAKLGDIPRQTEILERLANAGEGEPQTRSAALYTLAEIQLSRGETAAMGVAALERALDASPNDTRALEILEASVTALGEGGAVDSDLLALYERVCRSAGDQDRLLCCLVAAANQEGASPEQVRLAYDLGLELENDARAAALLCRAVACSTDLPDGIRRASWAMLALATRCDARGDILGAGEHYGRVFEVLDEAERAPVYAFADRLMASAQASELELGIAKQLYEQMMELQSAEGRVWDRLARVYARLGDIGSLRCLHDDVVDGLGERDDRCALRCTLARALVVHEEHVDEALARLEEVLDEDAESEEARELMAECMAKTGDTERLVVLLEQQLELACQGNDLSRVAGVSLRLGALFEDKDSARSLGVYRAALSRGVAGATVLSSMRRVLEQGGDDEELTDVYERLVAIEADPEAREKLAVLAGRRYRARGELDAARRVLEAGHYPARPSPAWIEELESVLMGSGDRSGQARLLSATAQGPEGTRRLMRAAELYEAENEVALALAAVEAAREGAPEDFDILGRWCGLLSGLGREGEIVAELTLRLDDGDGSAIHRAVLLRLRGDAQHVRGEYGLALDDLGEAFSISADDDLEQLYERRLVEALASIESGDTEDPGRARELTMLLSRLYAACNDRERQRTLLVGWVANNRKDVESLWEVLRLASDDEDWEAAVGTSNQLVAVTSDEAQVEAARWLHRTSRCLGEREVARRGLEHVRRKQPENAEVRDLLVDLYEALGDGRKLAKLLLADVEDVEGDERAALLGRAGELAVRGGEPELAVEVLVQALELRPGQHAWVVALGDAHVKCGDLEAAVQVMETEISASKRRSPELALLQHRRATLAELGGDMPGQLEWLEQAMMTDRHNLDIAADLARAAEQAEAWDVALKGLRTIALSDRATPQMRAETFARQGRIALINGDRKRAVFFAHKAKHEDAEVPVVVELVRMLEEQE
ncbi:MAG: hypothetical protein V3V08_25365 [Nannocystaceae bacterium]